MKIFEKIYSILTPKNIKYLSLISIVIITLFSTDNTFAEWTEQSQTQTDPAVWFLVGLIKIITVFLSISTVLISSLMAPEWTSWSVLWLNQPLKELWYLISNIVYFIFAIIFIYIAIMNILWKSWDYELKSALPRFIVWLLIVPFSWFIVQFIISISGILTVAVLSIPYDTFKNTDLFNDNKAEIPKCTNITINNDQTKSLADWNIKNFIDCWDEKITLKELLDPSKSSNIFWIINIYTYWVMKIDKNAVIFTQDLSAIKKTSDIILKLWFDWIFVLVYLLLLLALMMALFVRWFWMWIFAMFSPLFWLLHFFKKSSSWAWSWDMKNLNIVQFIKLAMMPVYVAWALSFWLLFLFVAWKSISWDIWNNTWSLKISKEWNVIVNWWTTITLKSPVTNEGTNIISWFNWSIWTFLLQLFWIAILWVAVISALKSSEITQSVVSPFENIWNSIWKLIKSAPSYAPIIPTTQWPQSIKWIEKLASSLEYMPSQLTNKRLEPLQNKINQSFNIETVNISDINTVKERLVSWIDSKEEFDEVRGIYLRAVEKFGHQNKDVMEMRELIATSLKTKSGSFIQSNKTLKQYDPSNFTWKLNDANFNKMIINDPSDSINIDKLSNSNAPWVIKASEIMNKWKTNEEKDTSQNWNSNNWPWKKVEIKWKNIETNNDIIQNKDEIIKDWKNLNEGQKDKLIEIYNEWPWNKQITKFDELIDELKNLK